MNECCENKPTLALRIRGVNRIQQEIECTARDIFHRIKVTPQGESKPRDIPDHVETLMEDTFESQNITLKLLQEILHELTED